MPVVLCIDCNKPYEIGAFGDVSSKRCPGCQKAKKRDYNTRYQRRYRALVRELKAKGVPFTKPISVSILNAKLRAWHDADGKRTIQCGDDPIREHSQGQI